MTWLKIMRNLRWSHQNLEALFKTDCLIWAAGIRVVCGKGESLQRFELALKAPSGGCVASKQNGVSS